MKLNKTILVGIDYTKSSVNALEYAILLAEKSNSTIILYHVYETPIAHTYSGAYFISYPDIDTYNKEKLEKFKQQFQNKHPNLKIETITTTGTFKNGIRKLLEKNKINYVVVGLESKTKFAKAIFGTTGVELAGKLECPVIIVPEKYKKHSLSTTILAVDNREYLRVKSTKQIDEYIKDFKLLKENIHIKTDDEFLYPVEKNVKKQNKELHVKEIKAPDFLNGIKLYSVKNNVDSIIIISRSHSAFYNLFNESNTKAIAYQSSKPVICIHE